MNDLKTVTLKDLNKSELLTTKGGNPILVGLGVLATMISLGRAADQAGEWFAQGWNNPK